MASKNKEAAAEKVLTAEEAVVLAEDIVIESPKQEQPEEPKEEITEPEKKKSTKKKSSSKKGTARASAPLKTTKRVKGESPTIQELIDGKVLLTAFVCASDFEGTKQSEVLTAQILGKFFPKATYCKIRREDADNNFKSGTVGYLVGKRVPIVLISVEEGEIYASRKEAQNIIGASLLNRFAQGEVFDAEIYSWAEFGAFVSVQGVVGLLKDADFSSDHTPVNEVFKLGDTVRVVCKEVAGDTKIYFKAEKKYHRPEAPQVDFKVGAIRIGKVVTIKAYNAAYYAYVRIKAGLDVMVRIPEEVDIAVDNRVKVQITQITESDKPYKGPRIKGNFLGEIHDK